MCVGLLITGGVARLASLLHGDAVSATTDREEVTVSENTMIKISFFIESVP